MAQNIYDDEAFFAGYSQLGRQVYGLEGAAEWQTLRSLMPAMQDAYVVDLGCGFGWHSRWAIDAGAERVVGIDVSKRMLERARANTTSTNIEYRRDDLDTLRLDANSFDVVISSLALHYVVDINRLFDAVAAALRPSGSLVFSVEHPIYSAPASQSLLTLADGRRVWPLDNYLVEGKRTTSWIADGVIKQHRTVATYVNSLVSAGFIIEQLIEWGPSPAQVEAQPELADDLHRPWFLLAAASLANP